MSFLDAKARQGNDTATIVVALVRVLLSPACASVPAASSGRAAACFPGGLQYEMTQDHLAHHGNYMHGRITRISVFSALSRFCRRVTAIS